MAKVRARPETGHLYFDFTWQRARCREQTTLPDTPANRKRTEEVLRRIEAEITLGTFDYARYFPKSGQIERLAQAGSEAKGGKTFQEFSDAWFLESQVRWRRSTREQLRGFLKVHLLPAFGSKELGAITRADILAFRATLAEPPAPSKRKPLGAKSINHIIAVARMIFAEATLQLGIKDPTLGIKRLRVQKREVEPFSIEEVKSLLATVRHDFKNYLTARFFTGMRTAEINGLKWKFVDFERRQILVRETFARGNTEYTKTDGSQRNIEMSSMVYDALKAQELVTRQKSEYVFCDREGHPIDVNNFTNRVWYPLLRHLGLALRRPYQCRHTCATLWLASGENPQWIANQLGHTTTEMLFRVYSRFVPNLTRKDGSAFERLLSTLKEV